jgi:hypothetical protein
LGQKLPRALQQFGSGRIERGFDFLGYRFAPAGLAVAKQTMANFIEKASRLYEQERSVRLRPPHRLRCTSGDSSAGHMEYSDQVCPGSNNRPEDGTKLISSRRIR